MNTTRPDDFFRSHHDIASHLDLVDWLIIGHINFSKELSHQKENDARGKVFRALMTAVAMFANVKAKSLVYFQNNEIEPAKDFHHIHFLLGRHGLEHLDAESICRHLTERANDLKIPDSQFEPFDPARDGVAYVTKKMFKQTQTAKFEVMPLDYVPSRGLVKVWNQKGMK